MDRIPALTRTAWRLAKLAARTWRVKRVRTIGAVLAIALGTGVVVWVSCCYESVRRTILAWASDYTGASHINIESVWGKYVQLPERLVGRIKALDGVERVTSRLVLPGEAVPISRGPGGQPTTKPQRSANTRGDVDVYGIDLTTEFAFRRHEVAAGRMLRDDDELACVVESSFAEEQGVRVGDRLALWVGASAEAREVTIVGLVERRRIARYQPGVILVRLSVLQRIALKQGLITSIDIVLADGSVQSLRAATTRINGAVAGDVGNINITSAAARMQQIETAQNQLEFVLVLLSCVALLTALFIILSTLSMGMVERIAQLGLMRCIGLTGGQLAWLVLLELVPLGVVGIAAGVPIGFGLTWLTTWLVPERFPYFVVSWRGIGLAAVGGALTTLVAAIAPALAARSVSPLEAAHPRARPPRRILLVGAFVLALIALLFQVPKVHRIAGLPDWITGVLNAYRVERSPYFMQNSAVAVILLYLVYALAAPVIVWLLGSPAVVVVATTLRVRVRLLQDQVGHAVWRSAGICCGMMVGLSLIVGLVVFTASLRGAWEFPKHFPEAYVWNDEYMWPDAGQVVAAVPGVKDFTVASTVSVIVEERPLFFETLLRSVTWFLAIDPDTFFDQLRLEFVEGTEAEARALLAQGGHVIIAADFARTRNKHRGDTVKVYLGQRQRTFTIAAVADSPALDIAATYFHAQSQAHVAAVGSVMGTLRDLERQFGVRGSNLVLLNFDLRPEPAPPGWPPPRAAPEAAGLRDWYFDERVPMQQRYERYREEQVLAAVRTKLETPYANSGTVRELKIEIDRELASMTRLLTAVPAVALVVAAIGVANLMTANVTSRVRQLAVLRAVGATRGLILRMVIGEALVLGLVGSLLGLWLGLHLAFDTAVMTERMWGFEMPFAMPWRHLAVAIALTIGLCTLAGILPARHAARTNVVDALREA